MTRLRRHTRTIKANFMCSWLQFVIHVFAAKNTRQWSVTAAIMRRRPHRDPWWRASGAGGVIHQADAIQPGSAPISLARAAHADTRCKHEDGGHIFCHALVQFTYFFWSFTWRDAYFNVLQRAAGWYSFHSNVINVTLRLAANCCYSSHTFPVLWFVDSFVCCENVAIRHVAAKNAKAAAFALFPSVHNQPATDCLSWNIILGRHFDVYYNLFEYSISALFWFFFKARSENGKLHFHLSCTFTLQVSSLDVFLKGELFYSYVNLTAN